MKKLVSDVNLKLILAYLNNYLNLLKTLTILRDL